jgi:hypothetical protein
MLTDRSVYPCNVYRIILLSMHCDARIVDSLYRHLCRYHIVTSMHVIKYGNYPCLSCALLLMHSHRTCQSWTLTSLVLLARPNDISNHCRVLFALSVKESPSYQVSLWNECFPNRWTDRLPVSINHVVRLSVAVYVLSSVPGAAALCYTDA